MLRQARLQYNYNGKLDVEKLSARLLTDAHKQT